MQRTEAVTESSKAKEPGIALGVALIALLVGLLVASVVVGGIKPEPMRPGLPSVLRGTYLLAVGAMFLAAYYFDHKTFFLRWVIWLCEKWSWPRKREGAFVYAALAFLVGGMGVLVGFGLFDLA